MFKKLREKISGWSKKFSEEAEETTEEPKEISEEAEKKAKSKEKKQKKDKKTEKLKKGTPKEKTSKKQSKKQKKDKKKEEQEESEKDEEKEIELPQKFDVAKQKYEPDLEKLDEKIKSKEEQKETSEKKQKKSWFKRKISEEDIKKYSEELEELLLENNVAFEVVEHIIERLKEKITEKEITKKQLETEIKETLKEIIKEILIEPFDFTKEIKENSPYVILFCGINGTGKTTTIAKIANKLKQQGFSCVLSASDTFRAASIEQLKKHGENLGIKVLSSQYGSDPASVGFDAIKYAEKNNIDCVLIDTAGRMYTDKNLLREIEKISRVCKPHLKLFVGESITGNDAIEQAKAFNETIELNGIVLSKADIDEKGGTALSIGQAIQKPILYLGVGQNYEDIEFFDKDKFIEKLGL